jgi:hypothetical protein
MDDLVDKVKWLQDNPEKAKQIAYEGSKFMQEIYRTEEVLCYTARVLKNYSQLLGYSPRPTSAAGFQHMEDVECPC